LRYAQIHRVFQSIVAEVGDNGLIRCQPWGDKPFRRSNVTGRKKPTAG
jgi:hypothetical protein